MPKALHLVAIETAIQSGQILHLLTPLFARDKIGVKRLSKLRAKLEELVVLLAHSPAEKARVEPSLVALHGVLSKSVQRYLNVCALVDLRCGAVPLTARSSQNLASNEAARVEVSGRQFAHKLLDGALDPPVPWLAASVPQERRAQVLHAFASAVRNFSWLQTLLGLGLSITEATRYAEVLGSQTGSSMGRQILPESLEAICPGGADLLAPPVRSARRKTRAIGVGGLFTMSAALDAKALAANPEIAALIDEATAAEGQTVPGPSVGQLFEVATAPFEVSPDEDATTKAQLKLDTLVEGLKTRIKVVSAERKKRVQAAQRASERDALARLRKLDPKLLKLLKANPKLLDEA